MLDVTSIAEIDLPFLDIYDETLARNPSAGIATLRAQHPWLAKCSFGYVIHEYKAINELLSMDDKFRTSNDAIVAFMEAEGTPWGSFMENMMLARSGTEHARLRSAVSGAFTPRNVNHHRSLMCEVVIGLLDEWLQQGAFDFTQFAAEFPVRITCALIGADLDDVLVVREALEAQALSFNLDKSFAPVVHKAYQQLFDFVDRLIRNRMQLDTPYGTQLLDMMITAKQDGKITDLELREVLIVLFAAGFDTTTNTLVLVMQLMMQYPEIWERCAADFDFCVKAVDEAMRYSSPSNVYRTVKDDFIYRGVLMPKETQLFFTLAQAGRDPGAFANPDDYAPQRGDRNRHIPFGRGMHMCLGMHLARAEMHEAMHLITQRMKNPRLNGEVIWRAFTGSWGIVSLPVAFERR
jgi:cytochrome P450